VLSGLTPEQIALRRTGIGGSDAGAIVAGGDEWPKLGRIKLGIDPEEDLSNELRVQMGIFTEPFNCYWYEKQTGRKVLRRNERAVHPRIPYIVINLDGVTRTEGGQLAYLDFKHVGKSGDQLTLRYTAQGTHGASVIGADWWCLSCFVGNSKWELTEQEVDPFFLAEYLELCREFWSYIERGKVPPPRDPLPVPPPRKLRTVTLDEELRNQWPNWGPSMAIEMASFSRTEAAAKANAIARTNIKELLPDDVGTVIRGRIKVVRSRNDAVRITIDKGKPE
jgi:hypothetical protein